LTEPGPNEDDLDPARSEPSGPPGGQIFTLEGKPVPSLYLLAWLFSVGGVAVAFLSLLAQPEVGRLLLLASLVALALGLSMACGYQLVARATRSADRYRGPSPLLVFALVLTLLYLAAAVLAPAGLADPDTASGLLAVVFVTCLAYLACLEVFVVRGGALTWFDMGWPVRVPGAARAMLTDVGIAFLVMIPVTLGVIVWGALLATALHVSAPQTLPDARGSGEALAVVLAAAVIAPIGEEAFFRGFALTAWLRDLGERSALARSALFFAFVHILNIRVAADQASQGLGQALLEFAVILPLGLTLGALFLRRGLVASITGHMTYNGILLVLVALARSAPTGT
jgi:membrane protease YdiL (CAAX protease family)